MAGKRSIPGARKKNQGTLLHSKSPVMIYTVKNINEPGKGIEGIITDVDALEMGIFSGQQIPRGTPVLLEIGGKLAGKLQAMIISCKIVPISNHILKNDPSGELWRLRIRAIVGGEDEAKFPQALIDALMKGDAE